MYENTGIITKGIYHWVTGDKMDATFVLLEILSGQIRKEINIPIMISIFTQFILYDLMRGIVMCGARWIKGSIIISCKITANFSFSNIQTSNCLQVWSCNCIKLSVNQFSQTWLICIMARYSNAYNSYQTLRGYKRAWCYQRKPVLRRNSRKNAVCVKVSLQNTCLGRPLRVSYTVSK